MYSAMEYDASANRATLIATGGDWYLWIEWSLRPSLFPTS
jgi:hypothetical protein